MTLKELKQAIEKIECNLSSIDIPVRVGKKDADLYFNLNLDNDGVLAANLVIIGGQDLYGSRTPLRRRIIDLGVGEEMEVSLDDYKASTVSNASCVIGHDMGRIYKTKSDWNRRVIIVIRAK